MSITEDMWMADNTKQGFMGMSGHWIEVKDGKWKMRGEVIGFKALSGAHNGENLGRYAVGLLEHGGIMDKKSTKACHIVLLPCSTIGFDVDFPMITISFTLQH